MRRGARGALRAVAATMVHRTGGVLAGEGRDRCRGVDKVQREARGGAKPWPKMPFLMPDVPHFRLDTGSLPGACGLTGSGGNESETRKKELLQPNFSEGALLSCVDLTMTSGRFPDARVQGKPRKCPEWEMLCSMRVTMRLFCRP